MSGCASCRWKCRRLPSRPIARLTSSTSPTAPPTASWTSAASSGSRASPGLRSPRFRPGWLRANRAAACRRPRCPMSMQQLTRSASWSFSASSTNQPRFQAGGVLEEDEGTVLQLAQARVELAQHGQQAVGLVPHLPVVVDDQAADAAREPVGELPDRGAALLVQQVDAAVQVDRGQAPVRGDELQDMLQLAGRVGVRLGGQARLGEAEASQLEQRIVPGHAPVEQGVQGLGHLLVRAGGRRAGLAGALTIGPGMIHDPSLRGAGPAHHPRAGAPAPLGRPLTPGPWAVPAPATSSSGTAAAAWSSRSCRCAHWPSRSSWPGRDQHASAPRWRAGTPPGPAGDRVLSR